MELNREMPPKISLCERIDVLANAEKEEAYGKRLIEETNAFVRKLKEDLAVFEEHNKSCKRFSNSIKSGSIRDIQNSINTLEKK